MQGESPFPVQATAGVDDLRPLPQQLASQDAIHSLSLLPYEVCGLQQTQPNIQKMSPGSWKQQLSAASRAQLLKDWDNNKKEKETNGNRSAQTGAIKRRKNSHSNSPQNRHNRKKTNKAKTVDSPLQLLWVKAVCMVRCNLPPVLLAEWPGSLRGGMDSE